jgi:hypothetical protein
MPDSKARDLQADAARIGPTPTEEALATIRDYLRKVRFGSISLTIHDGRIVQLDLTEKRRLTT